MPHGPEDTAFDVDPRILGPQDQQPLPIAPTDPAPDPTPAAPAVDFWKGLVDQGFIQGDPTYYSEGRAQPGEYAHALRVAWGAMAGADQSVKDKFWVDLVDQGFIEGDPTFYSDPDTIAQPAEFENAFVVADQAAIGAGGTPSPSAPGLPPGPRPPTPPGTEERGTPTASSVIPEDARLVRITNPAGSDLDEIFVLIGSAFGVDLAFEIGSRDRLNELFGGPDAFDDVQTLTQANFDASGAITVGDVDEVLGATGSIQAQMERDLRSAGLENPPQWLAQDHEAMTRWVVGVNEGFSAERLWVEVSDTNAFKERFSGLDTIFDQEGTNQFTTAIAEFTRREGLIRQSINTRRGPGADTSIDYVSGLIGGGWQPAEIDELLILERQLRDSPEALDNMNQILAFQELPELTPDDFISFLQDGQRLAVDPAFIPGDLFEGINDALRFQALIEEGLQIDLEFATELGEGVSDTIASPTQFSERARLAAIEIARNTTELDRQTLGISRDDIIAAAFGEESPSGKSVSEISELLERLGRDRAKRATGLPGAASFVDALGRLRVQGSSNL